jgi:hypothetical protein
MWPHASRYIRKDRLSVQTNQDRKEGRVIDGGCDDLGIGARRVLPAQAQRLSQDGVPSPGRWGSVLVS